jgi:serine-type D-Ala-D-Ala carboxypeptidase (penicillin-binding protein 5/6)
MTKRLIILLALAAFAAAAPAASAAPACPQVTATSAVLIDAGTGHVLCEKVADSKRPIASTTKLMTILLALEDAKLSDIVVAPRYRAAVAESVMGLRTGERITVADLIRAAMIYSANDAANALADHLGGGSIDSFVRQMNRRAQQLGLANTHYSNPIGLDAPGNYSTAEDLVKLTIELRKFSFFRRTVRQPKITLQSGARPRTFTNRNNLVGSTASPWVDGVKTGHTLQAGYVLVASGRQHGVSLIAADLGAPSVAARNSDSLTLLRWGYGKYIARQAVARGQVLGPGIPIRYRPGAVLNLVAVRTVHRWVLHGTHFERVVRGVPSEVEGPIEQGRKLGEVDVYATEPHGERRLVTTVSLAAASEVPATTAARKVQTAVTAPWLLLPLLGLIAIAAVLARRGARPRRPRERAA